ncbi:MAG: CHAT domain-containing protein, partial [Pyrinomonadaceae bacterium]
MWINLEISQYKLVLVFVAVVLVLHTPVRSMVFQTQTGTAESSRGARQVPPEGQQIPKLEIGKPVVRAIAGGQAHPYEILATAGDYLNVVVDQRAVDVIVSLFAPDGRKILEVDSPNGAFGPEPLMTLIESTGRHRIEIRTFAGSTIAGAYEVRVQELRAATVEDKSRVPMVLAAQQAQDRAVQLVNKSPDSARSAIPVFDKALSLWRQLGQKYWEALCLNSLGQTYNSLDDKQKALDYFNQALALQRDVGDRHGEASTLDAVAEIYHQLGEEQKALDYFNRALPLRKSLGDMRGEGLTLIGLGRVYFTLGETLKALELFNQGLPLFNAVSDRSGEATTLANIGKIYSHIGHSQESLEFYNRALALYVAVGNRSGEAKTRIDIGGVYYGLGEKQKALDLFTQALSFFRAVNDRNSEGITLNNIGLVYSSLGEKQRAMEFFNLALPPQIAVGNRGGEATTLNNIGALYNSLGERQKALEFFNRALALYRTLRNLSGEATTLNNIGEVYDSLGERQKALEFFSQALPIRRNTNDKSGEANTLNSIGVLYGESGESQKALELLNQALPLYQTAGNRSGEATTLGNIGSIHRKLGDVQKALELFNQALALQRAAGNRDGEATTLSNIGTFYSDAGEYQKALEFYIEALPILRAIGDRAGEALTLINMMLLWSEHNSSVAVFFGKQAVNLLQELRASVTGLDKEKQKSFLKTNERTYRILAYMLIGSGRLSEAQQVLNLFKDQQFFDFNRNTDQPISNLTLTPRESLMAARFEQASQRVEVVGQQLSDLTRRVGEQKLTGETTAQLQQLQAQLKIASDELLAVLKQAETEFSRSNSEVDKVGEIADTRELQGTLRELTQQTGQKAVAVYTLLDKELEGEGDGTFSALVVTADSITVTSQPIKGDAVNKKALQLWALLQSDKYDPKPLAQDLYSIVFKPLEALLPKDTSTILWSLDGNLRYVPMAALHDGKQYLVERYHHVVFTRADRERLLRAVSPRWSGLGLGSSGAHTVEVLGDKISFSALPGVTEELRALFRQKGSPGGVLEGEVLPDARFTKAAMLAALKQKRPLVHISSHFAFRPGDEARSFLLLGDGTAMTLEEMKQQLDLFAGVELLTLSAC